jgi:hypothetical protein
MVCQSLTRRPKIRLHRALPGQLTRQVAAAQDGVYACRLLYFGAVQANCAAYGFVSTAY